MLSAHRTIPRRIGRPRAVLGIDFGTTYTSVALILDSWGPNAKPQVLAEYKGDRHADLPNRQVPSIIAYSDSSSTLPNLIGYDALNLFAKNAGHATRAAYPENYKIEHAKLLLYESEHTKRSRTELIDKLNQLKAAGIIDEYHDVIRDYLAAILRHIKSVMERRYGVTNDCDIEVAFCVPVAGNQASYAIMAMCMREAMRDAELGTGGSTPFNLFMGNEAETAAMYAFEAEVHIVRAGEVIVNIDSGGGSTEGACYEVSHDSPLRFAREVIAARGILVGGTDVNEAFEEFLRKDVRDASYFGVIQQGRTWEDEIKACVRHFDILKRNFADANDGGMHEFPLFGLLDSDGNRRLTEGEYVLTSKDMGRIFSKVADKIDTLMIHLLNDARNHTREVNVMVLTGGNGNSPYLQTRLRTLLNAYNDREGTDVEFIVAHNQGAGISTCVGTLMRALNKEHGPVRALRMSVGFVRTIRWQSKVYEEMGRKDVTAQRRNRGPDGKMYIDNVVEYPLKVGQIEDSRFFSQVYESAHYFSEDDLVWMASEELVMHPTAQADWLKKDHASNEGLISAGVSDFYLTHLKPRIMEVHPPELVSKNKYTRKNIYAVKLGIRIEVNDVDVKLTALYQGPDDMVPVEIPGFAVCQNVRGLLDPGTGT